MKILLSALSLTLLFTWAHLLLPFEVFDEQSHFASVEYLYNNQEMPKDRHPNLSLELEQVERIFGVMTDGSNRYTSNPSYHPEFAFNSDIGLHELEIQTLNTHELRSTYRIPQAAVYPPLYYAATSLVYRFSSPKDLLSRLYSTRLLSLILVTGTILVTFYTYSLFLNPAESLLIATLTLLYPMTTFIGAGVNSDNLHNFLFAIFLYYLTRYMVSGWSYSLAPSIGVAIGLDMLTKPQAYIMLPLILLAIIVSSQSKTLLHNLRFLLLTLGAFSLVAGWYEFPKYLANKLPYLASSTSKSVSSISLSTYLHSILIKFSGELSVWYWGIFKWSHLVLPKVWWGTANRLGLLAFFGLFIHFYRQMRARKYSVKDRFILFSLGANLIYLLALLFYDWQYLRESGRSLGFQARYFMPLLSSQLYLLYTGLVAWSRNRRFTYYLQILLLSFFLSLQVVSIYTVADSYYTTTNIAVFIHEVSQYKPFYAKGSIWIAIALLYLACLATILYSNVKRLKQEAT